MPKETEMSTDLFILLAWWAYWLSMFAFMGWLAEKLDRREHG